MVTIKMILSSKVAIIKALKTAKNQENKTVPKMVARIVLTLNEEISSFAGCSGKIGISLAKGIIKTWE